MGLLEGLAGASVWRFGAGEMAAWRPEDSLGVLLSRPHRRLWIHHRDSLSGAGAACGSNRPPLPPTNAGNPTFPNYLWHSV